jgi:diguanylate cyclase (GGDEF)-like protein
MGVKILAVDDSRLNVRLLKDILEAEGYSVYTTTNSLEVVQMVSEIKPDVILLDIVMPGMDGFEVCSLLKKNYETMDIPIIMVTARTDGMDIKKSLELGAFDYIKKPIDEIEVIARVQSALRFKDYQDKLKEMAMKDSLTGIYNHALLVDLLEKEFLKQKRKNGNLCFVMIDIDHFKNINDNYGHMAGDKVLQELSQMLCNLVRGSDIVGRYGGEEFGIILPEISQNDAFHLCDRLRTSVEKNRFQLTDKAVNITISVGASIYNVNSDVNYSEIIKNADQALYSAKAEGRNRVKFYC